MLVFGDARSARSAELWPGERLVSAQRGDRRGCEEETQSGGAFHFQDSEAVEQNCQTRGTDCKSLTVAGGCGIVICGVFFNGRASMVFSLWLPILLSAVALFFASFLSWMVLQLHKHDWMKLNREDEFLKAAREINLGPGNYVFPGCDSHADMKNPEYQQKMQQGPRGVMTVFPQVDMGRDMGRNLALTMLYFLVVSFCIEYLATLALPRGAAFVPVFRFVSTAGLLVFLSAIVSHSIWFRCRITGHVIESIAYAAIIGAFFGLLWPG